MDTTDCLQPYDNLLPPRSFAYKVSATLLRHHEGLLTKPTQTNKRNARLEKQSKKNERMTIMTIVSDASPRAQMITLPHTRDIEQCAICQQIIYHLTSILLAYVQQSRTLYCIRGRGVTRRGEKTGFKGLELRTVKIKRKKRNSRGKTVWL